MGKLLTDEAVYKRLDSLTARLDTCWPTSSGPGHGRPAAAGQAALREHERRGGAAALIAEIKKDPKKYLNVRVSIF